MTILFWCAALAIVLAGVAFFPIGKYFPKETGGERNVIAIAMASFNEEKLNAHFKVLFADLQRMKGVAELFLRDHGRFPSSTEEADYNFQNISQNISSIEFHGGGDVVINLSRMFGVERYLKATPTLSDDGDVAEWTCRSNVSNGVMKSTPCSSVSSASDT